MLSNCPRCGFQQPLDKYCAQCGVDIENYRPAAPPFWKRFFGNMAVQVSVLVILAVVASVVVYNRGQENLERRVTYLKSTVQIKPSSLATSAPTEEALPETLEAEVSSAADQASQAPAIAGATTAGVASETTAAGAPSPTAAGEVPGNARSVARSSSHLVVYYAEVDRNALNALISASRNTGQFMSFNDYSAGILPRISKSINGPTIKILHKEDRPLETDVKSLQWFFGLTDPRDPSRQIGLNTYFEMTDSDTRNLRGNIEVLRTWREENASGAFEVQKKTFPAIFEIGGDIGFFMYGVMPRQSHLPDETDLLKIDIYKILSSPAFRAGESEFVIFVEFQKNN